MLRKWWAVLFFMGVLVLAVLLFSPTPQSPLAQDEKIQKLINNPSWGDNLLLPTSLPGKAYVREAVMTNWSDWSDQSPTFVFMEMDLMMHDGGEIGRLKIAEQKTDLLELPTVDGVPVYAVEKIVEGRRQADTSNRIGKLEAVEVGDSTGYWYTRVDAAHRQFEVQAMEFLQDGLHVQISVNLPESTFSKEKLIEIARSFRAF